MFLRSKSNLQKFQLIMTTFSLDVYLDKLDKDVFIRQRLIRAHPHLYVVRGRFCQFPVEQRRRVFFAAAVARVAVPSIPHRVVEVYRPSYSSITEVVIADKSGAVPQHVDLAANVQMCSLG